MKLHNLVYCKHDESHNRAYLYELPLNAEVKAGEKLCVEDRNGEHVIPAFSRNFFADSEVTEIICTANGGYYPPAKAIGKVKTHEFTVTQDCVEKFDGGEQWLI